MDARPRQPRSAHPRPQNAKADYLAAFHERAQRGRHWIRQQGVVGAPIASARTPEQLGALFESATLRLAPDELAALGAITAPTPVPATATA